MTDDDSEKSEPPTVSLGESAGRTVEASASASRKSLIAMSPEQRSDLLGKWAVSVDGEIAVKAAVASFDRLQNTANDAGNSLMLGSRQVVANAASAVSLSKKTIEAAVSSYVRQCNEWRDEIVTDEKRLQGYSRAEKDGLLSWDWLIEVARIQFNLTEEQAWDLSFDEFMGLWRARVDCDTRQHFAIEKAVERELERRATTGAETRDGGGGMGEGDISIKRPDDAEVLSNAGATALTRPSPDVSWIEFSFDPMPVLVERQGQPVVIPMLGQLEARKPALARDLNLEGGRQSEAFLANVLPSLSNPVPAYAHLRAESFGRYARLAAEAGATLEEFDRCMLVDVPLLLLAFPPFSWETPDMLSELAIGMVLFLNRSKLDLSGGADDPSPHLGVTFCRALRHQYVKWKSEAYLRQTMLNALSQAGVEGASYRGAGIETAPPSTTETAIESAPLIPTVVRDERKRRITEYKRECRLAGVTVTDKMIAQAANKNWSDRTMVAKFKDCTAKDGPVDLIMRVLREKPHLKK